MNDSAEAYDLGAVGATPASRPNRPPFPIQSSPAWTEPESAGYELPASFSLFLPGSGQLMRREMLLGVFFLSSIAFLGVLSWAILTTFDRLTGTLTLLEVSLALPLWILVTVYCCAAGLHVACVLNASARRPTVVRLVPPPFVPGLASALVPGWGQLLNGDRARAGVFLGGLWAVAAVWIVGSPAATEFFNTYVTSVGTWEQTLRQPAVAWTARWTLPVLLWGLAIYDAASSAANRR